MPQESFMPLRNWQLHNHTANNTDDAKGICQLADDVQMEAIIDSKR